VVQHSTPEGAPIFARGGESWQLHPEIARRGHDHRIEKSLASAFAGTRLAEWLQEKGIDTLTIAGYMSHNCDVSTALEAYHRGMTVEFLSDGTGSLPYANDAGRASAEEIHRVISVVLHANFAAVVPTDAWIAAVKDGAVLRKDNIIASNQRGAAAA
jgi:nicotinamidase-related amidase